MNIHMGSNKDNRKQYICKQILNVVTLIKMKTDYAMIEIISLTLNRFHFHKIFKYYKKVIFPNQIFIFSSSLLS